MTTIRAWSLLVVTLGLVLCPSHCRAQQDPDRDHYYRAVAYCRGDVSRPMALSPDGQVLCFDGAIEEDTDVSLARSLNERGLFVVRSSGGNGASAIVLSDLIRERSAAVVVYDHCLSACAMFFLIASHQSYVLKGTLVAWHYPRFRDPAYPVCTYLTDLRDGKLKKLQRGSCGILGEKVPTVSPEVVRFFGDRVIDRSFDPPPDSLYVRRMLRNFYGDTGVFRDILWTLHPRYYPVWFKTKIVYEAYPQSQQEVDEMASRLFLERVIFDP